MKKAKKVFSTLLPFIAVALVYVVFKIMQPERFGTADGMFLILQQSLIQSIIACGIFFLLSMGFFDFTVGVNAAMATVVGVLLGEKFGWVGFILGALVTGVVLATIAGQMLTKINAPAMILSVGLVIIFEAICAKLPGDRLRLPLPTAFRPLGLWPYNVIVSVVVVVIVMLIYKYTRFGLYVRAVGSNRAIATNMGINVNKYMAFAFLLCGICAAIYGVVNACYSASVSSPSGMSSATAIFKPIMACMFAISFKKYLNPILGVFVGILFLNLVANGLLANGLESSLQNIVVGLCLIIVVKLSSTSRKYDVVK